MSRSATVLNSMTFMRKEARQAGFTLTELLTTVAIIGIISAIALPAFSSYYDKCCLMSAVSGITGMIDEARQLAESDDKEYGVGFNSTKGQVILIAGTGEDGEWNTADDKVIRSISLPTNVHFGYGSYKPYGGKAENGVTFEHNNTLICNSRLTGTAGTAHLITRSGAAMAIVANSKDYGYKLFRWDGKQWQQM